MKQILIGALLAALAMFFWGFLFWAVPWPNPAYNKLTPEAETVLWEALRDHVPETGAYFLPNAFETHDATTATRRHEEGPLAMLLVRKEGSPIMNPAIFVFGFLHMFATAAFLGLFLRTLGPLAATYRQRLLCISMLAMIAAFWANIGDPIWNLHPWTYHLTNFVYDISTWFVAGLVLARFVKPENLSA